MSTPLQPIITDAGLQAVFAASNDGLSMRITHIALGADAYNPTRAQTRLRNEKARFPVADGTRVSPTQIHLSAIADGTSQFWVREVGFILEDGTLLAVWSDPDQPLAYKTANVDLLLAFDLSLAALPADSVTVVSSGAGLNLVLSEELATLAAGQIRTIRQNLALFDQLTTVAEQARVAQQTADYLWRTYH